MMNNNSGIAPSFGLSPGAMRARMPAAPMLGMQPSGQLNMDQLMLANLLMGDRSTPITHPMQGLSRIAQGALLGSAMDGALGLPNISELALLGGYGR